MNAIKVNDYAWLKCLSSIALVVGLSIGSSALAESEQTGRGPLDLEFVNHLRNVGVWDACQNMKIDFNQIFAPLASRTDHQYRRYRWSVDSMGQIHALPPEEEMGWTPWEQWSLKDGKAVHKEWVQYPVQASIERGIIPWYALPESRYLTPRFIKECPDFEAFLRRARVDVGAEWLGLDFKKTFLDSVPLEVQELYRQFRWVLVPHVLADNGPVIYVLPPMHKSDEWPWLSYYTDGVDPQILHVHYTAKKTRTLKETWTEPQGAPQRPPEIYGRIWHWYDEPIVKLPIIEKFKPKQLLSVEN